MFHLILYTLKKSVSSNNIHIEKRVFHLTLYTCRCSPTFSSIYEPLQHVLYQWVCLPRIKDEQQTTCTFSVLTNKRCDREYRRVILSKLESVLSKERPQSKCHPRGLLPCGGQTHGSLDSGVITLWWPDNYVQTCGLCASLFTVVVSYHSDATR